MRIGLVRRGYSPAGGAESYLRGFAQAAVAAGHQTVLFGSPEWPAWPYGGFQAVGGKSPRAFSEALAKLRPREKCDCLFSLERVSNCDIYRAGDGVHAAWLERRASFESAWKNLSFRLNPKHRELLALEKQAMTGARRIIANSRMVRDEIERFHGPEIAAKVHVIHNGIDPAKWSGAPAPKAELRARFQIDPDQRVVAFIGSGWDRKGLRFAIEATGRLAKTRLLVSGKGDPAKFAAPHVRFLGPTPNVAAVLHAADAFILPTIYDPFSNATLEALAAGLPIITTTANGVAEILDPQTDGTAISNPADIPALSAALDHWLDDDRYEIRRFHAAAWTLERNFAETLHIITS